MDWIESIYKKLKEMLQRDSLKKAMVCYFLFIFLFVALFYFLTVWVCENRISLLQKLYFIEYKYIWGKKADLYIPYAVSAADKANNQIWILVRVKRYSLIVYTLIGVCVSSHIYYKEKLKEPLHLLQEEALYIRRDDLGFCCQYNSNDEMGEVCYIFEDMRLHLVENQKVLWNMIEEQRQVNAAFAHDIRTPLTVMRGYLDMIQTYYPQGTIRKEKMMEILEMLGKQVERLEKFSDTMKNLHGIEELLMKKKKGNLQALCKKIAQIAKGFYTDHCMIFIDFSGMGCFSVNNSLVSSSFMDHFFSDDFDENMNITINHFFDCYFDENVILEVLDNLLSNACRFAKSEVHVRGELSGDMFFLFIQDNGCGFTKKDLEKAVNPYYSGEKKDEIHFGLGLTIAKKLCEKHGGNLRLTNSIDGGAIVCAEFCVKR